MTMKNQDKWKPTKVLYQERKKTFQANPGGIYGGSYHVVSVQIVHYIPLLQRYIFGDLLDCGCGQVPYYEVYKTNVTSITCIDWDENNIFLDSVCDLNRPLPYESQVFDSILLADVIAHIGNVEGLFLELTRLLKPGGTLLIFSPFFYWINEAPFDFQRLTEYAYTKYCNSNNLSILEIRPYGGRLDIMMDLLNKKFPVGLSNRAFCKISEFVRASGWLAGSNLKSTKLFPLGYCVVAKKLV
jgi:SAM-dependent methyltransferase